MLKFIGIKFCQEGTYGSFDLTLIFHVFLGQFVTPMREVKGTLRFLNFIPNFKGFRKFLF